MPLISASCSNNQIDINSASSDELDKLTGIGPSTAEKIIDSRPYETLQDLTKVYGIGESKLQDIKSQGLACVSDENELVDGSSTNLENLVGQSSESIINLNSVNKNKEEIQENYVFESKNGLVIRYSIFAFCIFLILIIFFLLWKQ